MWTRTQLKANAKYAMRGRYGKCLLASLAQDVVPLLYSLITTIAMLVVVIPIYVTLFTTPEVVEDERWIWWMLNEINAVNTRINSTAFLYYGLSIFVVLPLSVGVARFFVHNRFGHVDLGLVKTAFTASYSRSMGAMFTTNVFIALWSLLFIFPGIIKSLEYSMVRGVSCCAPLWRSVPSRSLAISLIISLVLSLSVLLFRIICFKPEIV